MPSLKSQIISHKQKILEDLTEKQSYATAKKRICSMEIAY